MSDLLGSFMPDRPKSDKKMQLALLLRFLAQMIDDDGEDDTLPEGFDGRATEPAEVRVRPRIEPMGG